MEIKIVRSKTNLKIKKTTPKPFNCVFQLSNSQDYAKGKRRSIFAAKYWEIKKV